MLERAINASTEDMDEDPITLIILSKKKKKKNLILGLL
jgi:hypothetical protein